MKNLILLFAVVLMAGWCFGQQAATVECRVGGGVVKELNLFKTVNGRLERIGQGVLDEKGYFGFKFIPEYEGFYVIGDDRDYQYPVYLKPGDAVSVFFDPDGVRLDGRTTAENRVLYDWIAISGGIEAKAVRFFRSHSTYTDFFPDFERFLVAADRFKPSVNTKNDRFNELMKRSIDFEKDYYALNFIYTPRSAHPTAEQRPVFYKTILSPDKLKDDVLLQMPYGYRFLGVYTMFANMEAKGKGDLESILSVVPDQCLKGELVIGNAERFKTYAQYKDAMERYGVLLTPSQKLRMEEVGAKLYDTREGAEAADFTYPDLEGKEISLSDFKGKVVVVDVWATWCGPCRQQIPHLKKLEAELEGKDVVFIGVSVDVEKDHAKWKKMVADEQLSGIHLFANGWSKIAKDYKITGIPRFMVFDRKGNIVSVDAPRPSEPALKTLIEEELKK